jgi:hexosaminidase
MRSRVVVLVFGGAVSVCAASLGLTGCANKQPRAAEPSRVPAAAGPMHRVVPIPATIEASGGRFVFTADTVILAEPNDEVTRVARYLARTLGTAAGPNELRVEQSTTPRPGTVQLSLTRSAPAQPNAALDESYELTIAPERITIAAPNAAGLFYGAQTLRQLLPPWVEYRAAVADKSRSLSAPAGRIVDRPRFAWRGAMLDVARHFFDASDVKRYIDLIALYKINRLHLHLSDDQGWRIEIKSWPKLTAHGGSTAVGGGAGGYYTQDVYKDLVSYAQERFITIVPEIDMPGHTNAALASYPELNCDGAAPQLYTGINVGFSTLCVDKPVTYTFIDDVVREIAAMTPGPYYHAGGDEVQKLTPAQYNQFIERVQAIVQKHGKQMIGWDEIAGIALLPTSIVQHWRPKPGEGLAKAPRLILSPANRVYLDMKYEPSTVLGLSWAGNISIRHAYEWDPASAVKGAAEGALLGVETPIWSETLTYLHDVEFMAFPRLAAVAEVAWSSSDRRTWEDFARRLGAQAPRWQALGVNFNRVADIPWER